MVGGRLRGLWWVGDGRQPDPPSSTTLSLHRFGHSLDQERDWPMSVGRIVRRGLACCVLGCVVLAAAAGFRGIVLARPAADAAPTGMDPTKVMGYTACMRLPQAGNRRLAGVSSRRQFRQNAEHGQGQGFRRQNGRRPGQHPAGRHVRGLPRAECAGHGDPLSDHGGVLRVLPRGLRRRERLVQPARQLRQKGVWSARRRRPSTK